MKVERALIAVDLDGTALQDLYTLNEDTLRALQAAQAQGHLVMLATARPSCMTLGHYETIGLNSPVAVLNGAYTYHPKDPAFIRIERLIPKNSAERLIRLLERLETSAVWMENDDDLYQRGEMVASGYFAELLRCSRVHRVEAFPLVASGRIFAFTRDEAGAMRTLSEAEELPGVDSNLSKWRDGTLRLSFHSPGCDKWYAVQAVAERYGVPAKRIFTFGDEENDRRMILNAAHGYVMSNGNELLRAAAVASGAVMTEDDNIRGGVGRELDQALRLGIFSAPEALHAQDT